MFTLGWPLTVTRLMGRQAIMAGCGPTDLLYKELITAVSPVSQGGVYTLSASKFPEKLTTLYSVTLCME